MRSAGEIWAMAIDPAQEVVAVASAAPELQLFSVAPPPSSAATLATDGANAPLAQRASHEASNDANGARTHDVLESIGSLKREVASHRICELAFVENGAVLAACSAGMRCCVLEMRSLLLVGLGCTACTAAEQLTAAHSGQWPLRVMGSTRTSPPICTRPQQCSSSCVGKHLQLWHKRTPQDAQRKLKRRQKRRRAKLDRTDADAGAAADQADEPAWIEGLSAADQWQETAAWRPDVALRGCTAIPKRNAAALCQLATLHLNNSLAVISVLPVCLSSIQFFYHGIC